MNERLFAIASGRVQMVMYRDFVERKATGLKLTGTVRNLENGTVEIVAEGPRASLENLVSKLRKGPLLAHVEAVTTAWQPANGAFSKFEIAYE